MVKNSYFLGAAFLVLSGCEFPGSSPSTSAATTSGPYIYVASGTTYAGLGTVMSTPSNTIVRFQENGAFDSVVVDYSNFPGDTPVDIMNYDDNNILALIENSTGSRRIDKVAKDGSGFSTFLSNSSALSAQMRSMFATLDGGWIVSKGTSLEKFSSNKSRVLEGAAPYVSAPAGACSASATLISRTLQGPSGTIIFLHDAASPNNRVGLVKSTGYAVAADCLSAVSGPTANHYPTAGLLLGEGPLLVGYSNKTGPVDEIYSYPISSTVISDGVSAYNNRSVLSGVTAMVELAPATLLIASGASTYNTIEEFTYNTTTSALSRVGTTAFISASIYTKSISAMLIAD